MKSPKAQRKERSCASFESSLRAASSRSRRPAPKGWFLRVRGGQHWCLRAYRRAPRPRAAYLADANGLLAAVVVFLAHATQFEESI